MKKSLALDEMSGEALYNPPIKKYKVSNQKVQNGACFSRPVFVSLSHLEGGHFRPF